MPTVFITGGHSGIGFECAKRLASGSKLNLILAGRSLERLEVAAKQLRAIDGVKVHTLEMDTSSLASVRAAAARCRMMMDSGEVDRLQSILCNAGAQFPGPISYSEEGYEKTFATNYLGHFLLVESLFDRVADRGRIVFTASGTHDPDTMDGKLIGRAVEPDAMALAGDGKDGAKPLPAGVRYSTSKLCMILFAYELDRRSKRSGSSIASIAFDPGATPDTGLLRSQPKPVQWLSKTRLLRWTFKRLGVTTGTVSFSGDALARIVADPAFADGSGHYYQSNDGSLSERRSSKMSYDEVRAAKLWTDSKLLVKLEPTEEPMQLR